MGGVGIIMIAMGHENYIKMAVNLAASIKHQSKVAIHIVHDGGFATLSDQEKLLFDSHEIPRSNIWNTSGKPDYIKPKTRLYELSPFDKTLYLDVDMIWLSGKPIEALLAELVGTPFAIMNEGPQERCYWADPEEIRKVVGSDHPMHVYYGELIYFEKGELVKAFFSQVKKNFDKPVVSTKKFAGSAMPDELAYILASLQTGLMPHKTNWLPIYWYLRDKKYRHLQPFQLPKEVYAYSIGGNVTPEYAKAHYNNLVAHYSNKMGISRPYKVRDKKSFIAERSKY